MQLKIDEYGRHGKGLSTMPFFLYWHNLAAGCWHVE